MIGSAYADSPSRRWIRRIFACLAMVGVILLSMASSPLLFVEASRTVVSDIVATTTAEPTSVPYSWSLPITVGSPSVLVIDLARGVPLYEKNSDLLVPLPVVNKAMTALIGLENYTLDSMVTISEVAADADDGKLGLKRGEKVRFEYLLLALMLQDSDAAAIAIAEQVSGVEADFVVEMNTRARDLQMTNTFFLNATGRDELLQHSTVADAVLLFRKALTLSSFERVFRLRDILYLEQDAMTRHFRSKLDVAWSYIDSMTGGMRCDAPSGASAVCSARSRGFPVLVAVAQSAPDGVVTDLIRSIEGTFSAYEYITLVTAGQAYSRKETIQGVTFDLVFSSSVSYVSPIGHDYLKNVLYESVGKTTLPIKSTQVVGKAIFEMVDGTSISVNLYPATDIRNHSSRFDEIREVIDENRDLTIIILVLVGFTVLSGLTKSAEWIVRRTRKNRQRMTAGRTLRR